MQDGGGRKHGEAKGRYRQLKASAASALRVGFSVVYRELGKVE
jgi:hypothetical protein